MANIHNNALKEMLNKLGIKRAIVIDDKLKERYDINKIMDILDGRMDDEEIDIVSELEDIGYDNIDEVREKVLAEEVPKEVLDLCTKISSDIINSELSEFLTAIHDLFGEDNVDTYYDTNEILKCGFNDDTILFLDYQLEENPPHSSEELATILAYDSESKDINSPRCIVFMSNKLEFSNDETTFNMTNTIDKYKYFKSLRLKNKKKEYKNSLYDYIPKMNLKDKTQIEYSLDGVFNNLYAGKVFYTLLSQINQVLTYSSEEVLGKFHLLNARSIKEILQSKVAQEGIAEHVFLIDWISRNITKSVTRNDKIIQEIHRTLNTINELEPISELHEDIELFQMLASEMWDSTINDRFEPIEFGDVFEINYDGSKRQGILLTQSCTLAVRGDGNRAGKTGLLVMENLGEKSMKSPSVFSDFTDWNGEKISFSFDETMTICLDLLDLTTLDDKGNAIIPINLMDRLQEANAKACWSKGYYERMKEVTNRIDNKIKSDNVDNRLIQVDQTWMSYDKVDENYSFSIRRICRLDYQCTLHLYQKADAWWGRIGLPVNLNFLSDLKEVKGIIQINDKYKYEDIFYVKEKGNGFQDVMLSIESIKSAIRQTFNCKDYINDVNRCLDMDCIATINPFSGKKLLSVKKDLKPKQELGKNKIYFTLDDKDKSNIELEINIGIFNKCIFNGKDITSELHGDIIYQPDGTIFRLRLGIPEEYLLGTIELSKKKIFEIKGKRYYRFDSLELLDYFNIEYNDASIEINNIPQQILEENVS